MTRVTLGQIKNEIGLIAPRCCFLFRLNGPVISEDDLPLELVSLFGSIRDNEIISNEMLVGLASFVIMNLVGVALPSIVFRSDDYFKLRVARAIFTDERLQEQYQVDTPCFLNLLLPLALNSRRLNGEPIGDDFSVLYYLERYIIHESDILATLRQTGRFCNPMFPARVLPEEVIARLCGRHFGLIEHSIREHIASVDQIPTVTLSLLVGTLSSVCLASEEGQSLLESIATVNVFIEQINGVCKLYGSNMLTQLSCHPEGRNIQDYILHFQNPPVEGVCLSEMASNICEILNMVIDGRCILTRYQPRDNQEMLRYNTFV